MSKSLPELTPVTRLNGTEQILVNQAGNPRRATARAVAYLAGGDRSLNLLDFIPQAEWADLRNGTSSYDCLAALGMESNVTLFTASDFGRTLTTDNDGSDHAWGSNQFVVGGAVNGKRIYGQYPQLYVDNPLEFGR